MKEAKVLLDRLRSRLSRGESLVISNLTISMASLRELGEVKSNGANVISVPLGMAFHKPWSVSSKRYIGDCKGLTDEEKEFLLSVPFPVLNVNSNGLVPLTKILFLKDMGVRLMAEAKCWSYNTPCNGSHQCRVLCDLGNFNSRDKELYIRFCNLCHKYYSHRGL